MDYKTRQKLSERELRWYYQGKMLDDADELGLYEDYLEWLTSHRRLDELKRLSEIFDSAIWHIDKLPKSEIKRITAQDHVRDEMQS